MTDQPLFLSVNQVLEIHERLIQDFGGDPSVRDHGLLESAVRLPCATFDGKLLHESLPHMAAAYLFHLCMNHPFVDGNKRTALATSEIFLILNGLRLDASDEALHELTMGVASGGLSKTEVLLFFAEHAMS
jgi:death-on-curing protein